jgi:hypothetical protein
VAVSAVPGEDLGDVGDILRRRAEIDDAGAQQVTATDVRLLRLEVPTPAVHGANRYFNAMVQ